MPRRSNRLAAHSVCSEMWPTAARHPALMRKGRDVAWDPERVGMLGHSLLNLWKKRPDCVCAEVRNVFQESRSVAQVEPAAVLPANGYRDESAPLAAKAATNALHV